MTTTTTAPITRSLVDDDMARIISGIPRDLQHLLTQTRGLVLAGGCIRALVAGEPVSDFDLFGPNAAMMILASEALAQERRSKGYLVSTVQTGNAITVLTLGRTPVQFITRWNFPDAETAVASFDFTVAQAAVWYRSSPSPSPEPVQPDGWQGICTQAFYPDLAARRLVYTAPVRDEDACGSLLRVRRFLAKGYTIQATSLAAAIARAVCGVPELKIAVNEAMAARLLAERIREVDPLRITDQVDLQADHLADR